MLRTARISKVQASISKVNNWGKYASNGVLNTDEWREVFLEAAQAGDLRRVVRLLLITVQLISRAQYTHVVENPLHALHT